MKREAKLLLEKACDSLVLSIELFNRPHDRGRTCATLIQLDHSFEMLLKAAILHRGGQIREKRASGTIGFDACVRRSLTDGKVKFLSEDQAIVLRAINGQRDAAQHYLLDISEAQLYVHVQSGVTLFRDLFRAVFDRELMLQLPSRVLPVSTIPPTELATLFDTEVEEVKKLLRPGSRRQIEAMAKLRPLAILNNTILGELDQPSDSELRRVGSYIASGKSWVEVFQGVAAIEVTADGAGPSLSLRLSKSDGIPVQLVPEGDPSAAVVGHRRVSELDFYSLGARQLAGKVGLSMPKVVAIVDYLGLRSEVSCYKEFRIGGSVFKRYSPYAITAVKEALKERTAEEIWREQRPMRSRGRRT